MASFDLFERRLLIIGGKGGVGRTTIAAALALAATRRGKRVLLVQTNAKDRLSRLLDVPAFGEEIVRIGDRLDAVNTNPRAALKEYGLMVLRFEAVYRAVFENKMVRSLLRAVPGLDDYSMLGKTWYHTTETRGGQQLYDLVILDGPATGHLLTMLRIPKVILEAVPEGPLTRDARSARELLTDPRRSAVVLVTLAEEMPTAEAIEFDAAVRGDLGMTVPVLVVNGLWPARFTGAEPPAQTLSTVAPTDGSNPSAEQSTVAGDPVLGPLVRRALTTRHRRALNERYLARLEREVPAGIKTRLPFLFSTDFRDGEVGTLSHLLEDQLAGRAV